MFLGYLLAEVLPASLLGKDKGRQGKIMANRNYLSNKLYQFEAYPVLLSCNFVVDSTNGNGLGLRSLKGAGVNHVFMHTTTTPGVVKGITNPNPANGVIQVQLQDNYNRYLLGSWGTVSPLSGSSVTSVVRYTAYTIVSVGTTTLAQWQSAGLPQGLTPTVGQTFIAIKTGALGGTGAVQVVKTTGSGIDSIEVMGDPNTTLTVQKSPENGGGIIVLNCFTNQAVTAPADGTVIGLQFYLSNSSVTVQGQ